MSRILKTLISYIPYGDEIYNASTNETFTTTITSNDYGYNGKYDLETGLYYEHSRRNSNAEIEVSVNENDEYITIPDSYGGTIAYPSTFSR